MKEEVLLRCQALVEPFLWVQRQAQLLPLQRLMVVDTPQSHEEVSLEFQALVEPLMPGMATHSLPAPVG